MKILTLITRILVGAVFIFSGLIKANDPLGFSYKLVEYFEVLHIEFLIPAALFLAIFICVFEVILGAMLLMGARVKTTLWLSMLMIVFFTFLTFYSAYFDVVKECGCFGDFLHMTPWTSFTKDLILLVLLIILFIGKQYINPLFNPRIENALLTLVTAASVAFPLYTYNYLPVKDFRAYAIGKNIPEQTKGIPDELKYFYKLKDKKTGEVKEFDKWPDKWDEIYDYVDNRTEVTKKGIEPQIKDFSVSSLEGSDYTGDIIENPNHNFLLICYDLDKTNRAVFGQVNDFAALCKTDSVTIVVLTASTKEAVAKFKEETKTNIDFYNTDGTVLKTMIRSNPGLMLLKAGTVVDMWHYNSFPSYNDVKEKYFKK